MRLNSRPYLGPVQSWIQAINSYIFNIPATRSKRQSELTKAKYHL